MSGARPDTWMPFYWGDYLRDTMHLRTEGHGAYMLLIGHYWHNGRPLPDDDDYLRAVTKLDPKAWGKLKPTLAAFFDVGDGVWRHKRVDDELETAQAKLDAKSKAGKKGAERRWQINGRGNGKRIAEPMAERDVRQWQTDAPSPSPNTPSQEIEVGKGRTEQRQGGSA